MLFFLRAANFLLFIILVTACQQEKPVSENPLRVDQHTDRKVMEGLIGKDYLIDNQHSYIGFKIKYFGNSPVRGRFNDFSGTLFYDEEELSSLSVSVIISTNSINTGNERRDSDLTSEDTWFDTDHFPFIIFQSANVIVQQGGGFDLVGSLTIKGVTKTDTIHFSPPTSISRDWARNEQVDFSGTLVLNRQDFGVFGGDFWSSIMENGVTQLSDEVVVELEMHCRRADYQARYEAADSTDINKVILDVIKQDGVQEGVQKIDEFFKEERLTSGALSSIGYTLTDWKLYDEANTIFGKRLEYFPTISTTYTQLGILNLLRGDSAIAIENFEKSLVMDSVNTRTIEYLRIYRN